MKLKSWLFGLMQGYSGKTREIGYTQCLRFSSQLLSLLVTNSRTQVPRVPRNEEKTYTQLSWLGPPLTSVEWIACDILNLGRENHLVATTQALTHPSSISVKGFENQNNFLLLTRILT